MAFSSFQSFSILNRFVRVLSGLFKQNNAIESSNRVEQQDRMTESSDMIVLKGQAQSGAVASLLSL